MGKSQKPLTIMVTDRAMFEWDKIKAYQAQGHIIFTVPWEDMNIEPVDIVMGPQCWRMDEEHRQFLDLAIQEARKIKYPKEEKGGKTDS